MKLWRCHNPKCQTNEHPHGRDFTAEVGKCPDCGIEKTHPRFGQLLVQLVVIHFDAPSGIVEGFGVGHPACLPNEKIGKYRGTGVPGVVNCPACKETASFKAAFTETKMDPAYDVPIVAGEIEGSIELAKVS